MRDLGSCSAGRLVNSGLCLAVGCVNARLGSLLTLHTEIIRLRHASFMMWLLIHRRLPH